MAESGAHLSSATVSDNESCPSIFEVLAQESLLSTLKPALRHILRVAAVRNPARYSQIYAYCDELYAALQLVLENYYLKQHNATFSENFYGLRRIPLQTEEDKDADEADSLTISERLRSLFILIIVPYVKSKLDRWYEQHSEMSESAENTPRGLKGHLYRTFLYLYPLLHTAWEGSVLYFQLIYIIGKTNCHSPLLRLAGLRLRSLTDEEQLDTRTVPPLSVLLANKSLLQQLSILVSKMLTLCSVTLSTSLSVGVFFLQFLDWWYGSDQRVIDVMALPNPGPPQKYVVDKRYQLPNVCPLCNKLRTNDTALSVSGFVFCYPCIFNYVKEKGCCPITGYPVRQDQLVRLFQSDET